MHLTTSLSERTDILAKRSHTMYLTRTVSMVKLYLVVNLIQTLAVNTDDMTFPVVRSAIGNQVLVSKAKMVPAEPISGGCYHLLVLLKAVHVNPRAVFRSFTSFIDWSTPFLIRQNETYSFGEILPHVWRQWECAVGMLLPRVVPVRSLLGCMVCIYCIYVCALTKR